MSKAKYERGYPAITNKLIHFFDQIIWLSDESHLPVFPILLIFKKYKEGTFLKVKFSCSTLSCKVFDTSQRIKISIWF